MNSDQITNAKKNAMLFELQTHMAHMHNRRRIMRRASRGMGAMIAIGLVAWMGHIVASPPLASPLPATMIAESNTSPITIVQTRRGLTDRYRIEPPRSRVEVIASDDALRDALTAADSSIGLIRFQGDLRIINLPEPSHLQH